MKMRLSNVKRLISAILITLILTLGLVSCRKAENSKNGNNLTPVIIEFSEIG